MVDFDGKMVRVKMRKVVYTSIDYFRLKNWEVCSYKALNEKFVYWIEETTFKLLNKRTSVELKAMEELKEEYDCIYEQPFFMIRGRSYFLDFYLPKHKLAIEIDGKNHKDRASIDKQRDSLFREIGIRTIRIDAKDVYKGKLMEVLAYKLMTLKKKKSKQKRVKKCEVTKESNMIHAAKKRLREHDKNKHRAKWI